MVKETKNERSLNLLLGLKDTADHRARGNAICRLRLGEWHKVTDRVPREGEWVIVCFPVGEYCISSSPMEVLTGRYHDIEGWITTSGNKFTKFGYTPTHWASFTRLKK